MMMNIENAKMYKLVDSIWLPHLLASRPVVREAADATSLEAVDT